MPNRTLENKVAIVTGSAQGIGKAVALALAGKGALVYCLDIKDVQNERTAKEASASLGKECTPIHCDLSDPNEIKHAFERIFREQERIDILINNAAVFSMVSLINDSYEKVLEDYEFNMAINARGTLLCSKMVAPVMAKAKSGHIINVNTNHIKRYLYSVSRKEHNYDASKYAQQSFSQSMARELADYGIRVNAICPAATRTEMLNSYFNPSDLPLTAERIGRSTSVASLLEPEEVAEAVCGMITWPVDAPVGKEYLVMFSEDCQKLSRGPVEDLAK